MGTKVTPVVANNGNIFSLKFTLYELSLHKFISPFHEYIGESWLRYLDNCFITWNETYDKPVDYKSTLSNIKPNIQFTIEYISFHLWTF